MMALIFFSFFQDLTGADWLQVLGMWGFPATLLFAIAIAFWKFAKGVAPKLLDAVQAHLEMVSALRDSMGTIKEAIDRMEMSMNRRDDRWEAFLNRLDRRLEVLERHQGLPPPQREDLRES